MRMISNDFLTPSRPYYIAALLPWYLYCTMNLYTGHQSFPLLTRAFEFLLSAQISIRKEEVKVYIPKYINSNDHIKIERGINIRIRILRILAADLADTTRMMNKKLKIYSSPSQTEKVLKKAAKYVANKMLEWPIIRAHWPLNISKFQQNPFSLRWLRDF